MVNAQGDHNKIQSKFYGWLVYVAFFMRGPEFDSHGNLKFTVKLFKGTRSQALGFHGNSHFQYCVVTVV